LVDVVTVMLLLAFTEELWLVIGTCT